MQRRNFLVSFIFWILSFAFGYRVGNAERPDSTLVPSDKDKLTETVEYTVNMLHPKYGVKADGVTDDLLKMQGVIDELVNMIRSTGKYTNPSVIIMPAGDYKITGTLEIPPYIKLVSVGFVVISYDGSGTAIEIKSGEEPTFYKEMYNRGAIINGANGGFIIRNLRDKPEGSIGLDLGNKLKGKSAFGRYNLCDVAITGFNHAVNLGDIDNYIGKFDRLHLEGNNYSIRVQNTVSTKNSGENFSFNDCVLANGLAAILLDTDSFDLTFTGCSFDFLDNVVVFKGGNEGYCTLRFTDCYYESIRDAIAKTLHNRKPSSYNNPNLFFNNCIGFIERRTHFKGDINVFINGFELRYTQKLYEDYRLFLTDTRGEKQFNNVLFSRDYHQLLASSHNLILNSIDENKQGNSLLSGTLIGYKLKASSKIRSAEVTDKVLYNGRKTLKIQTTEKNSYIDFTLKDNIKAQFGDKYLLGMIMGAKSVSPPNLSYSIEAYNKNGVKIADSGNYAENFVVDSSITFRMQPVIKQLICPPGTESINITVVISNMQYEGYLADLFINKIF